MAIYHLSVKAVSRSAGRSATAAAAYRAGCKGLAITDERTGEIHDYRRKRGVESADIVLPDGVPEWAADRSKLWNAAELAEKRKDACVAREFEVALPAELSPAERRRLALDFAKDMANREGCAVDVAIHAPGKEGDNRNHHAHILRTTRKVEAEGLGAKLDTEKAGRKRSDDLEAVRVRWADMTNQRLRENGINASIDHRSLKVQGIEREPTKHLGPAASGYERRTGAPSDRRIQHEQDATDQLAKAKQAGELERQALQAVRSVIDLDGDLAAAVAEREQQLKIQREQENEQRINRSLGRIGSNVEAAGRARADAGRALLASKQSLAAAAGHTRGIERGIGGALQGAERRIAERDYGRVVDAARRKFAVAGDLVQQVVGHIDHVVRPIAAAAEQVAQRQRQAPIRAQQQPGINPKSYYHPDNIAKRAAEEAVAAAVKAAEAEAEAEILAERRAMWAERAAIRAEEKAQAAAAAAPVEPSNPSGAAGSLTVPPQSFLDKLSASWDAMVKWIRDLGPLARQVAVDTERGAYSGQVVEMDELHAIQKLDRTTFAIHRLDALDKKPLLGDHGTGIRYHDGRGTVTDTLSIAPRFGPRKGGQGR